MGRGVSPGVSANTERAVIESSVAVQAVGRGAVAVDIDHDASAMAGGAVGESREKGMVLVLVASPEICVIGGVACDTGAALASIYGFIRGFQGACSGGIDVACSTAVAAFVVNCQDNHGVVVLSCLVVTGRALGAGGDFA